METTKELKESPSINYFFIFLSFSKIQPQNDLEIHLDVVTVAWNPPSINSRIEYYNNNDGSLTSSVTLMICSKL